MLLKEINAFKIHFVSLGLSIEIADVQGFYCKKLKDIEPRKDLNRFIFPHNLVFIVSR
jgi:hypothetical protein